MKNIWIILLLVAAVSCSEENNTPTKPVNDDFDPALATKLKMGDFAGVGGHSVSGMAVTYDDNGAKVLLFEPFTSQNGPDLKVYLSKDASASSYINLGNLKSVSGEQSYSIPGNPNLDEYPYILIWCQQFGVGFGKANLK